ncbi:MAG: ferredoxin-type protein NapG [Betaproteobacteria bacterium]|nr:ferredoxin-type protein NapG [Betaproteobacteria bacterium]MCC6246518.1 ferredoxin-type protein NapG [Rubrivivax sp.]
MQDPAARRARRRFLLDTAKGACGAGAVGLMLALQARQARALPPLAIRPPGALAEADFAAACVRCGLCVRDCPYDILTLATPEQPVATGTPYFVARDKPCEMCEHIPCVVACPTGALDHALVEITKAKMGLAVLVDQENCLNFLGLRCDICYRVCPVIDKAITLEQQLNARTGKHALFIPVVHSDACTGCGKCEKACPLEVAAIKVYPVDLAKGEPGRHYRLGWVEKDKAGAPLVAPEPEHRYNLPEGMRYEPGKGLSVDPGGAASAPEQTQLPAPAAAPVSPVAPNASAASSPAGTRPAPATRVTPSAPPAPTPRALQGDKL